MKKIKREKSTTTKGHYVTNAQLLPAVIEAKKLGRVTDRLAKMLLLIAERYSRKSWFSGYSYREDMVAHAVANLCQNALKFDHTRYNNPFAYYTTAIHHSFQQFKGEEKKQRNTRDALLVEAGANPSFNYLDAEREQLELKLDSDQAQPAALPPASEEGQVNLPERSTLREKSHAPGAVTVYKPGTFFQDENGNLIFIDDQERLKVKKGKHGENIVTVKRATGAGHKKGPNKKPVKRESAKTKGRADKAKIPKLVTPRKIMKNKSATKRADSKATPPRVIKTK